MRGFKHENFRLALGHGAMFDTARDDAELSCLQSHETVTKLNGHSTAPDQEQFILLFVLMPRKNPGKLHQLELLAIQLGNYFGSPMLVDECKFLA